MNKETKEKYKILREHAWNYFEYHAKQRLTTFNFYILICSLLLTGYFTLLKDLSELRCAVFSFLFGFLLFFLSFVFHRLDDRNKQLIKNSEEALKYFEDEIGMPNSKNKVHVANIFRYEEHTTDELKKSSWIKKVYSFSYCFKLIFYTFKGIGAILIFYSLFYFFCVSKCPCSAYWY